MDICFLDDSVSSDTLPQTWHDTSGNLESGCRSSFGRGRGMDWATGAIGDSVKPTFPSLHMACGLRDVSNIY